VCIHAQSLCRVDDVMNFSHFPEGNYFTEKAIEYSGKIYIPQLESCRPY